ncbi:MAG: barstar family protein [Actinomycetales bacterium]|nr:barstar family protein [Actinomycetales bacterium]
MKRFDGNASVRALVARARAAGRVVRIVEGGVDKHSSLVAFAEGLALPEWFGLNLDALNDALRDLADEQGREIELVWDRVGRLHENDPKAYGAILAVLLDIEAERDDLQITVVDR